MRGTLLLTLLVALVVAGCASDKSAPPTGGAPSAPQSASATETIAGTWQAIDADPLAGLTFLKDGTVEQNLSHNAGVLEMRGTWEVQGPGRILCRQVRAGSPNVHAVYSYELDGDELTLRWIEQDGLPVSKGDQRLPWLAGAQRTTIELRR